MWTGLILCRSCAGDHSGCEFLSAMGMPCQEDRISQCSFLSSNSSILFAPSSTMFLSLGENSIDVPLRWACPDHLLDQLWVSALTTAHCKMKLLWLKGALIYGYKYLQGSLTTYPFSGTTVVGVPFLLEYIHPKIMSFQPVLQDQISIPSCEV